MTKIYAVANQKGGVGKTTTARNLADVLREKGRKVLLVDLDQQASLSAYCGLKPELLTETIYNVFDSYIDLNSAPRPLASIIHQVREGMDLAPANEELAALDLDLIHAMERERILQQALAPVLPNYDYVLLDCPPNLSLLVVNALVAATDVLITLQADYLATRGVSRLLKLVGAVKARLNPNLTVAGILITLADQRTTHARRIIERTRKDFDGRVPVFETIIKMSSRLKDTPITGQSILEYDPRSEAATAFRQLAAELEEEVEHANEDA
jgi:chromosome partitioning protein